MQQQQQQLNHSNVHQVTAIVIRGGDGPERADQALGMGGVGLFGNGGGGAARGLPELIERIRREHLRRGNDLNRQ